MAEIREPKKVNSIEKKKRIIEAGLALFKENGYYNTNTAEIAKRANVSSGIVYSYFKDKKDIFLQGMDLYFADELIPIQKAVSSITKIDDLEKLIRSIIKINLEMHEKNSKAHEEIEAMSHLDKDIHQKFVDYEHQLIDYIIDHLIKIGYNQDHLEEKMHLVYMLVETLAHEMTFNRHDDVDYNIMIDETVKIISNMFK